MGVGSPHTAMARRRRTTIGNGKGRMTLDDLHTNTRRASTLLKAMGNERRLMILCHLSEGEKSVGELETLVGLSQSAISQHLARLRRDGLVRTRRSAQNILYSLNGDDARTVMATLDDLFGDRAHCPVEHPDNDHPAATQA